MGYLANTRASIFRGTTPNAHGDEVDANVTPVAGMAGFAASIIERSRVVFNHETGERRTVRYAIGRVPPALDVRDGDRIRDDRRGVFYVIEEFTYTPYTLAGTSELRLDLRIS